MDQTLHRPTNRTTWMLRLGILTMVAMGLLAFSWLHFLDNKTTARDEARIEIQGGAKLEAHLLGNWLHERRGDAAQIFNSASIMADLDRAITGSPSDRAAVEEWLRKLQANFDYCELVLYDHAGNIICGISCDSQVLPAADTEVSNALTATNVVFADMHRDPDGKIKLGYLIPVTTQAGSSHPDGVLGIWAKPLDEIGSSIMNWPSSFESGEIYLIRRSEDGQAVLLSQKRYHPEILPCQVIPGVASNSIIGLALRDRTGSLEGVGLRGVPLIAYVQEVPGSPWLVIAQVDDKEVISHAWTEMTYFSLILGLLVALVLTLIMALTRQARLKSLQRQLEGERQQAELARKYKETEQQFRALFENSVDGILIADEQGTIFAANPAVCSQLRMTEREICQRGRMGLVDPEDGRLKSLQESREKIGRAYGELRLVRGDGSKVEVEMSSARFETPGGKRCGIIVRDITARKAQEAEIQRLNKLYAALSEISHASATAKDQAELFAKVCQALTHIGIFKFVWVGWINEELKQVKPFARHGEEKNYLENLEIFINDQPGGRGPAGKCIRENRISVCNDFLSDQDTAPWHGRAEKAGFRAAVAVPIHLGSKVVGCVVAYATETNVFSEKEVLLLEQAGKDIDAALNHFKTDEERRIASDSLRRSEQELIEAQRIGRMGSWTFDPNTGKATWSRQLFDMFRIDPSAPAPSYAEFKQLLKPHSREIFEHAATRLDETDQPYEVELEIIRADGSTGWIWQHGERFSKQSADNRLIRGVALDITRRKEAELALIEAQLFAHSTLNSLSAHIAILDADGTIIAVNNAWRTFARENGADPEKVGEGTNYLAAIKSLKADEAIKIQPIGEGIREVLAGKKNDFHFEYTCHSPTRQRWFRGRVTRFAGAGAARAVVAHEDITSIRQAAADVEQSELRFRQLAQQSSTVIWEVNPQGLYTYISETAAPNWGYAPEELINRKYFYDLHPEPSRDRFKAGALAVMKEQGTFKNLVNPIQCKDGKIIWVNTNGIPVRDATGRLAGYRGADTDITDRKLAEEQLRLSEERFRKFFQQHSAVMMMGNPATGQIIDVNDAAAAFYGWSAREMRTKKIQEINVQPADVVLPRLQKIAAGQAARYETTHRLADGSLRDLEVFLTGIETGGTLSHFAILHDITQRKRAEEERRRLMVAIDQSDEAIVFTDAKAKILYVNQGFERITGYTRAEVLGGSPRILKSGIQSPEFYRAMWETLRGGEVWHGKFSNRRKDGAVFEEEATISPIHDEAKKIIGYVAVKRDITRVSELEKQLIEAQKMEAIGQLAGGVAHDYNNILAATIIQLGMLMADDTLSESVHEALQDLKSGADRAASLTRQLLLFSRRQAMQKKPIELNSLLEDSLKMLRRLIGEHIELIVMARADTAWIEGDPGMIEQVIMNLCLNARDAMPNGGQMILAVRIIELQEGSGISNVMARPGKYACLSVADRGIGMSPETMAHIFEPFFTTKGVGKGTGLGLATVHGIARQHGGWVEVTSELGKGSEFCVLLPLVERTAIDSASTSLAEIKTGQETILLVEDELAVRRPLAHALRLAGYRVFEAENGVDAVKLWHQLPDQIDLLLTDMVMPGGVNGLQLAETLRRIRPQLRVIISSGYSNVLFNAKEMERTEYSYIAKPYELSQLTILIREHFDTQNKNESQKT